ncbi:hypothetical protein PV327_011102, partial [Microctonus hyperodae]
MYSFSHLILFLCSFIFIFCVSFSYSQTSNTKLNQKKCNTLIKDSSKSQIILFFAPLTTARIKEQIVVYYRNHKFSKGADVVAIYETDPQTGNPNMIYSFEPTTGSGFQHTGITPLKLTYNTNSTFNKECLGYSGAWLRYGNVRKMTCLSTHPDWMKFAGYYLPLPAIYEWDMTLGNIWKAGKRLILSYDHVLYRNMSSIWSPITQIWGDVQDLAALKNHLISAEGIMIEPRASMAQITFDTWGSVKNFGAHFFGMETSSLLQYGAMVGPHITQWYDE